MGLTQRSAEGLDQFHYAVLISDDKDGTPVYGTIRPLPGAKTLSLNVAASLSTNFADDKPFEVTETTGEKGLTMGVVDLLPEDLAALTGYTLQNGIISGNKESDSPFIAILCRVKLNGGAYGYVRYFKVKFGKPNSEDATREATVSPRMITLEGRIADLESDSWGNKWFEKTRDDDPTVSSTAITNWFTAITHSGSALGAVTVAAAGGSLDIDFTFTKAGGNTEMNESTFVADNIIISNDTTGAIQTPTWTFGASGGATQVVTASGLTAADYDYVITSRVTDVNGVGVTRKAGKVTVTA